MALEASAELKAATGASAATARTAAAIALLAVAAASAVFVRVLTVALASSSAAATIVSEAALRWQRRTPHGNVSGSAARPGVGDYESAAASTESSEMGSQRSRLRQS
jgi:hypothetical protein